MMQRTFADLRAACRNLLRAPLFSMFICALLGIGLGANTLVFTLVDKLLLRPLAVEKPAQLLRLGIQFSPVYTGYDHPYIFSSVLRDRAKSFSEVFVSWPLEMALNDGRNVESVSAETVSGNYFAALGLKPKEGRLLSVEDERTDAQVAVLSQHLTQRLFGGRSRLGSTIRLRGSQFTIVGVLGPAFSGTDLEQRTDVWLTMAAGKLWFTKHDNTHAASHIFVRLREGVTRQNAEQEVQTLYPAMVDADAATRPTSQNADLGTKARKPLLESAARGTASMRKTFRLSMGLLMSSVTALLLLVSANIAGLLIVRAQARQRDMAIRLSFGATQFSLLRQQVFEVLVLSLFGAAGGWALAYLIAPFCVHLLPQRKPMAIDLLPDARVFLFALLACGLITLVTSFLYAVHQVRAEPGAILSKSGGGRTTSRQISRGLVAFQVALSTVLLLGAVSLTQTLQNIRAQDPGFRRHNLIVMTVNARVAGIVGERIPQVFDELVRRIEKLPDVRSVAVADQTLMRGIGLKSTIGIPGSRIGIKDHLNTSANSVSASYFETLGTRLLEGRLLRPGDAVMKPIPVVVNRSFARRFFAGTNALEKTFGFADANRVAQSSFRVVGIVNDARYRTMRDSPPTYFDLLTRETIAYSDGEALYIATNGDPKHVMQRARNSK